MLPLFFDTRGYVAEGLRWTRALVASTTAEGDTFPRAVALAALGWLEMLAGDPDESEWALSTAVEMCRRLDDDEWVGRSLAMRGMTTYNRGLYDEAEAQFLEAIEICDRNGLEWLSDGWCAYGLAHVALARNDFVKAETLLNEAFEFSDAHGLTWGVGHTQLSLGVLAFMMGQLEQSVERLTRSLLVRQQLRDSRGICDCIGMMALHASVRGEHQLAAMLIGAAEVGREASGDLPVPWLQPLIEQATISATAALGEEYGKRCAAGRDLSTDQAVELILARLSPSDTDAEAVVVRA
jgi:tetratricopeptide (TPR) repeat protein